MRRRRFGPDFEARTGFVPSSLQASQLLAHFIFMKPGLFAHSPVRTRCPLNMRAQLLPQIAAKAARELQRALKSTTVGKSIGVTSFLPSATRKMRTVLCPVLAFVTVNIHARYSAYRRATHVTEIEKSFFKKLKQILTSQIHSVTIKLLTGSGLLRIPYERPISIHSSGQANQHGKEDAGSETPSHTSAGSRRACCCGRVVYAALCARTSKHIRTNSEQMLNFASPFQNCVLQEAVLGKKVCAKRAYATRRVSGPAGAEDWPRTTSPQQAACVLHLSCEVCQGSAATTARQHSGSIQHHRCVCFANL